MITYIKDLSDVETFCEEHNINARTKFLLQILCATKHSQDNFDSFFAKVRAYPERYRMQV